MTSIDPSVIVQTNYKKRCQSMKHLVLTTARDRTFSAIGVLGLLLKHHGCTCENLFIKTVIRATRYYQHNVHVLICAIFINNSTSVFSKTIFYLAALEFTQGSSLCFHWDKYLSLYFYSEIQLKPVYYCSISVFKSVGFTAFHVTETLQEAL